MENFAKINNLACRYWYKEQVYQISFKLNNFSSLQAVKTFLPTCAYKKTYKIGPVSYKKHFWKHKNSNTNPNTLLEHDFTNERHQSCEHKE